MTFRGTRGDISGNIGNGNITVRDATGSFRFAIGNGDSRMYNVTGSFVFSTGNGDITVRDTKGSFGLTTGNGEIGFRGELTPGSNNSFLAGNGAVTVELTGSPSVTLDCEIQQEGEIRYSLPLKVTEQSEYRLVGTVGDGEAELKVRTGIGDITIK